MESNPNKKLKILIVFDDMIADMIGNKKLNPIESNKGLIQQGFKEKTIQRANKQKYHF